MNGCLAQSSKSFIPAAYPVPINSGPTRCESAERLLLACQLAVPRLIPQVDGLGIAPSDFAEYGLAEIQFALAHQYVRYLKIDAAKLRADLIRALRPEVNPAGLVSEILQDFVPVQWWRFYAAQVAQASYARLLQSHNAQSSQAINSISNRLADIEELRARHENDRLAAVKRFGDLLRWPMPRTKFNDVEKVSPRLRVPEKKATKGRQNRAREAIR